MSVVLRSYIDLIEYLDVTHFWEYKFIYLKNEKYLHLRTIKTTVIYMI